MIFSIKRTKIVKQQHGIKLSTFRIFHQWTYTWSYQKLQLYHHNTQHSIFFSIKLKKYSWFLWYVYIIITNNTENLLVFWLKNIWNQNNCFQFFISPSSSLEAKTSVLRSNFLPQGLIPSLEVEDLEKEEKKKIPNMCESIGHWPLQGRCPAPPSPSSTIYLGRTRVPLII